ncbi:hypothetical protein FNF27_02692 [Cafeteria roenbergensis]|uniref:PPM-type phosphatase domain-containing protein n=1 Tax=Cafeteria roenbergensis TaxID=33653 RepID=A0A5A8EJJ7_CAFRO|nr:hypothetical protein FNF27_02692 [Cafeteria roenbergensis]
MGCAASNPSAAGSHRSQTLPSADAIRAIANSQPGGAVGRGGNRPGGHAKTLDTNKPVTSRPTRVDELWALPQPTRNPDDIVLPPDEEPLPDIEPGDRGQHNPQLGIIAAGRYRMGFSTKDEDRVAVHADWLTTRRQEASRLLKEGKDLPRRMTGAERTLLLGSRRSVTGGPDEAKAKPAPEALGSRVCFFAVLDGHGGDQVSNRLQRLLPAATVRALSAPTPEDAKRAVATAQAAAAAAAAAAAEAEAEAATAAAGAGDAPAAAPPASAVVPGWAQPDDASRQRLSTLPGAPAGPEVVFRGAVHARSRPCVAATAVRPRLNWLMRSIDEWVLSRRETMGDTAGTCLAAATIVGDALVVFNVGDCEAVLSVRGRPKELSRPHKASSEAEVKRIRKAGGNVHLRGSVFRVEGALAVSRSVGVAQLKIGRPASIIPDPHVRVVELTGEEEFLVMGSDGLFDKFPRKQDLVNTTKKYLRETRSATLSAEMLLNEAIDVRGSRDNASVVVVVFNQRGPPIDERTGRPRRTAECGGWGRGAGFARRAGGLPAAADGPKRFRGASSGAPLLAVLDTPARSASGVSAGAEQDTAQAAGAAAAPSSPGAARRGGEDSDAEPDLPGRDSAGAAAGAAAAGSAAARSRSASGQESNGSLTPEGGLRVATAADARRKERRRVGWREDEDGDEEEDTALAAGEAAASELAAPADARAVDLTLPLDGELPTGLGSEAAARSRSVSVSGAGGAGDFQALPVADLGERRASMPGAFHFAGPSSAADANGEAPEAAGIASHRTRRTLLDTPRSAMGERVLRARVFTEVAKEAALAARERAGHGDLDPAASGTGFGPVELVAAEV